MFSKHNNRSFFCDLATIVKECCIDHDINIDEMAEEFDDFLDELDENVINFVNRVGYNMDEELNDLSRPQK